MNNNKEWIGVDFDGTLVQDQAWDGPETCGAPIPLMINKVKVWLKEGKDVQIVTARVSYCVADLKPAKKFVEGWCKKIFGKVLPVRVDKDIHMVELWDDRAKQVFRNTGKSVEAEYYKLKLKYNELLALQNKD